MESPTPSLTCLQPTDMTYLAFGAESVVYRLDDGTVLKKHNHAEDARREAQYLRHLSSLPCVVDLNALDDVCLHLSFGGECLFDVMDRVDVQIVFDQLLDAVCQMHCMGVAHCDLKLDNLLWSEGRLRLCDFGHAHRADCLVEGGVIGSPSYASPEMYWGVPFWGVRADLWSCGIILVALRFHCFPFYKATMKCLEYRHFLTNLLSGLTPAASIAKMHPSCPMDEEWVRVHVDALLHPDPCQRGTARKM